MKTKYELDIEVHRDGDSCGRFYSWSNIITEGNTLDELVSNASIGKIDQDGGDFGDGPADSDWMVDLILEAAKEKYGLTDEDPTLWCSACLAVTREQCDCGPRPDND